MNRQCRAFRLTVWLTTSSLTVTASLAGAPSGRAQDTATQIVGDPPARVGRLARLDGVVSTHSAGSTQWTLAILNFPFVSGDALWTQPQAQADIEVGATLATLADSTEFDLASLDDHAVVAMEPQGAVFLDVRDVRPGDTYTINTPRGAVQIATAGEYEILAGDTGTPTRVAVVRGAAQVTSGSLALRVGQGQMAVVTGDQDVQGDVQALNTYDPFLTAMLARNSAPITTPQPVQDMTGAAGLAQYGSWQDSPDYGQVWYPQVAPDWVPYRDGSWSYVAPWGWTWVDNEPWGFAPFHYGRWAQVGERWCWVPRQYGAPEQFEPVYSPALVNFVVAGAVAGAAAGLLAASLASGRGDVGWVPLGPREAYEPPYGGSRRYRDRLNWGHGWHRPSWGDGEGHQRGRNGMINNAFANRHALTLAPVAAMARSQQIRPVARGFGSPAAHGLQPAGVRSLQGPLPIRPVAETRGLSPQAAQRLGLGGGPAHPPAPGPAIRPISPHQAALPGGRVPFRGGTVPTAARPEPGHAPGPAIQQAAPLRGPAAPQPPGRPAAPAMPSLRPHQPNAASAPPRAAGRLPEAGRAVAPPPRIVTPGGGAPAAGQPAIRPRPPAPAPRAELPRPVAPRVEPPRPPAIVRPEAPRQFEPRMQSPGIQGPRIQGPGMAPQPHFAAPRPGPPRAAPPPPGRPLHP